MATTTKTSTEGTDVSRRATCSAVTVLVVTVAVGTGVAAERSYPIDCLPDRVAAWNAAGPNPGGRFGAQWLPGIVLGPPGSSAPWEGSFSVASLGFGGSAVVAFDDTVIEDRPGPDFVVFENPFFRFPVPQDEDDFYQIFAEPGIVEVSADGTTWFAFPYDGDALAAAAGTEIDRATHSALAGTAGITPTFTGNWIVPDDVTTWDPGGPGGVSGAGGDAFDLATVGLDEARFVRVTDANLHNGPSGMAEGFDLDAVVALHARPLPPVSADSDGDGLSDAEELDLWDTSPAHADTDGDGTDDGREIAGCRDPLGSSATPAPRLEPRLWLLRAPGCTELRWSFAGTNRTYDVVRGELDRLVELAASIDLGPTTCLAADRVTPSWGCDNQTPSAGSAFFYLVRIDGEPSGWGRSGSLLPRTGGACP
jgi:hypothetical protein